MTWLKGATTWGELPQKLARLMCGEVADDSAVTCASGDRWVREYTRTVTDGVLNSTTTVTSATAAFVAADKGANVIGTGIPAGTTIASVTNGTTVVLSAAATASTSGVTLQICYDTVRTKAALDVSTGDCSGRTGYFALVYGVDSLQTGVTSRNGVCKVVSPFTSDPSTSGNHRWLVGVEVTVANTVPGNYSTAQVREKVFDPDNTTVIATNLRTPNAAGNVTGTNGFVYNVSDPSGTLLLLNAWVRAFTPTYMYGIDTWKMLYRLGTGSPAFTVAPPGVAGTDYDVVSPIAVAPTAWTISSVTLGERSSMFGGLGIKTATGLGSSPVYTVNFPMALAKGRILAGAGGLLSLDIGKTMTDGVSGTVARVLGGYRVTNWCKCASTAGSVTSSVAVQYWISVKSDGITLALNMDPASTGKLGTAWWGAYTPNDPTYDVFPINFGYVIGDYTADNTSQFVQVATQYGYLGQRRHQDGTEGRDWQTRWMRFDTQAYGVDHCGSYGGADMTSAVTSPSTSQAWAHNAVGLLTAIGTNANLPPRQAKPASDGKWWLYGHAYVEGDWGSTAGIATDNGQRILAGYQNTRYFFIPSDGWASGDELTDTLTGTKYLLLMPDYVGIGYRLRSAASTYWGGIAIAEL